MLNKEQSDTMQSFLVPLSELAIAMRDTLKLYDKLMDKNSFNVIVEVYTIMINETLNELKDRHDA